MHSEIYTPISVSPQRKGLQVVTSTELFASLTANSNTISASMSSSTSYEGINGTIISTELPEFIFREHDYTVPAPPPPSPISFCNDHHWLPPSMVKNASPPSRNESATV